MTGNSKFLNIVQSSSGLVTFGDGQREKIIGKDTLNIPGLPHLDNVLLVQGLRANLISISQLCDQNQNFYFNKYQCSVLHNVNQIVMESTRSSDNCQILTYNVTCDMTNAEESKLWHQRLGHMNYRDMDKLIKLEVVRGMPKVKVDNDGVCDEQTNKITPQGCKGNYN